MTTSFTLTIIKTSLVVASLPVNQYYDLNTKVGTTFYEVPAYTTSPIGSENLIVYSDASGVSKPSAVTFSSSLRKYDWSGVSKTGTFTLIMKGSLANCVPVTTSFTVSIS